jgi:polyisoprenoid-binding protein YceI
MRAELKVFTFKEGMLARMAHDLRLSLDTWDATLTEGRVSATLQLASARIDGVAHGASVDATALSDADKRKIHDSLTDDILHTQRFPTARYEGPVHVDGDAVTVDGKLTLHGTTRDCRFRLQPQTDHWTGEVTLIPSQFGIPPFKALAGAIRLQDRWVVRVSLWLEGQDPRTLVAQTQPTRFAP